MWISHFYHILRSSFWSLILGGEDACIPTQRLIKGSSGISLWACKYSRAAVWCWLIIVNWCPEIRIGGMESLCFTLMEWRSLLRLDSRFILKGKKNANWLESKFWGNMGMKIKHHLIPIYESHVKAKLYCIWDLSQKSINHFLEHID